MNTSNIKTLTHWITQRPQHQYVPRLVVIIIIVIDVIIDVIINIIGWLSKRTRTSLDEGARSKNTLIWSKQSRIQAVLHALPSPSDVRAPLLNQFNNIHKNISQFWLVKSSAVLFKQWRKELIQCKKRKQTTHSDWSMIKETHTWLIKSFVFKSSARPGWRNW